MDYQDIPNIVTMREVFIEAVMASPRLPSRVRDQVDSFGVRECVLEESYFHFLDEKIEAEERGPAWSQRLKIRRMELTGHSNRPLLNGVVQINHVEYLVTVDPSTREVIHWESYDA